MLGFIILRCVKSEVHNNYWIECYNCIRNFYPDNKILIIDDDSNYDFIKNDNIILTHTQIIDSEFKGSGELLPYYYFLKNKFCDKAVIIHDSVFIQKYIDFSNNNIFLWHFDNHIDSNEKNEKLLIEKLDNNNNVLEYYMKKEWNGIFGGMSIITYDFLKLIDNTYNISILLKYIKCRNRRMRFERVFACIFLYEKNNENNENNNDNYDNKDPSLFGNILKYCKWGYTYDKYIEDKNNNTIHKSIIKVWSGR